MKYTLANPTLDAQIAEIQRKLKLSMNGIVSGQMTQMGIIYKKNFGVSIPRIKEIASFYTPGHDLAQRLLNLQIRETMIMSTLLEPVESFTPQLAQNMVESFNQIEMVEQACMNLFCKLSWSPSICTEWIQSDIDWIQITGYVLAARIVEKLNQAEINMIIHKALKISESTDFHLYNAVGLCLSHFCRKNKETATTILEGIKAFAQTTSIGQQYISNEVKQEILFMDIL
jgi:3-methyladenine DNA glycosylase AlkD